MLRSGRTRIFRWIRFMAVVCLMTPHHIGFAEGHPGSVGWWPQLHHDAGNSGHGQSTVPDCPTVLWEIASPGGYHYAPSIFDGKVYVASETELFCYDAVTGEELWNFAPTYAYVGGNLAVSGGAVYIGAGSQAGNLAGIYCLDGESGSEIWHEPVNGAYVWDGAYDPVVWDGKVLYHEYSYDPYGYTYISYRLTLRNRFDGELIWSKNFYDASLSRPVVAEGKDFYLLIEGDLRKYDLLDASLDWELPYPFYGIPVYSDGHLFGGKAGKIVCLDAGSGEELWSYDAHGDGLPAIDGDRLYTGMYDGRLLCLDAGTGEEVWARLFDSGSFAGVSSGTGRVLVWTLDDNILRCLDAEAGDDVWSLPLNINYVARERPIAIADGRLYISTEDHLVVCLGDPSVTVSGTLNCIPASGTLPFQANMALVLHNSYPNQYRRGAMAIDLTLSNGSHYPDWRSGFTNLEPGASRVLLWQQDFPDHPPLVGENRFHLLVEDVTPAPFNQPPYPPAGDTCTDLAVVTGISR